MTKQEAIDYCYKHENEFKRDLYACGEDGCEQFECLIVCLEGNTINPDDLASYGMDY
jgi:hypothetical protein